MQDGRPTDAAAAARRASPPKALASTDLLPADVLLSRSHGRLADMIVAADQGDYSHAALWSGTGVVEATLDGIAERPLGKPRDVYRYHRDGQVLDPALRIAIVETARRYTGAHYAHTELYMLGVMFALGLRPGRPLLQDALELLGGPQAVALARSIEQELAARGRVPMICSELVARAYYEADPSRAHALRVSRSRPGPDAPRPRGAAASSVFAANDARDSDAWAELERSCRELLASAPDMATDAAASATGERKLLFGDIAVDAVTRRPLGAVTPGDLQSSPDLVLVGRISPDPA